MGHWDVNFIRAVQGWELKSVKFHGCNLWCISKRKEDKLCWKPDKNTGFTMSSYYRVLIGNGDLSPPWKCIWKSQILSRVAFFV